MSDDTYEGWKNRETWAIQLHLSNNEGDYRQMCEQAEEYVEESEERDDPYTVGLMADYIKEWTEEVFDLVVNPEDGPAGETARLFVSDVGSWWRADFYEIAEHWIDEARESLAS
jgi:hypothetical protein